MAEPSGPSDRGKLRVFLSHASSDKPTARELHRRLRSDGFEPWLDEIDLVPGQDWGLEIRRAVRASDVVVVCLSHTAIHKSGYLQKEIRLALDVAEEKPEGTIFIIPLKLEECELPERFASLQSASLFHEGGYERLLVALRARADAAAVMAPRASEQHALDVPSRLVAKRAAGTAWKRAAGALVSVALLVALSVLLSRRFAGTPQADGRRSTPTVSSAALPGMIRIPAGTFVMGRDDAPDLEETPAHVVDLAVFDLDSIPVTNAKYGDYLRVTGRSAPPDWVGGQPPSGQARWPVTSVSWEEANAYCRHLDKRLPTETEWEYAARGTDGRRYPWGNAHLVAVVNSREKALGTREAAGAHPENASPFRVLDMAGNVWQWTHDDYRSYRGRTPALAVPRDAKVVRGGSFRADSNHVTVTARNWEHAAARTETIGFRCAR